MPREKRNEPDEGPARTLKHQQILLGRQRGRREESCGNPRILAQVHKPESVSQPKTKQARAHGFKFHLRHRSHSPDHAGLRDPAQSRTPPHSPGPHGGWPGEEEPWVQLSSARLGSTPPWGKVSAGRSPGSCRHKSCPQATDTETGSPTATVREHRTQDGRAGKRPARAPPKHRAAPVPQMSQQWPLLGS